MKKIGITGIVNLEDNLGDQSMIFSIVDYYAKKSTAKITFFNTDDKRNIKKNKYKFEILEDLPIKAMFCLFKKTDEQKMAIKEYLQCDIVYLLLGFTLSSQMKYKSIIGSLLKIRFFYKKKINLIIAPQSIGPFDYKGMKKILFRILMRSLRRYNLHFMCREEMGIKLLKELKFNNVSLEADLVLARLEEINPRNIYNKYIKKPIPSINSEKDVLIIPNFRLLKYIPKDKLLNIYEDIVSKCLDIKNGKVFIFSHASDDIELTNEIYERFCYNRKVIYLKEKYNSMEIINLMKKFSFGVMARWHAYVHSLRAELPCVIIGWSEKYSYTASIYNQKKQLIDIRNQNPKEGINDAINWVIYNREDILNNIRIKNIEIRRKNILEREVKND